MILATLHGEHFELRKISSSLVVIKKRTVGDSTTCPVIIKSTGYRCHTVAGTNKLVMWRVRLNALLVGHKIFPIY